MTVSTTTSRVSYPGAGSAGPFSYGFQIFDEDDLVVVRVSSAGVRTTLTITTDYTVAGAGDRAGGTVTLTSALAVGETLVLARELDLVQETDLNTHGGAYYPEDVGRALDRGVMIDQQQQRVLDRALAVPDGSTADATLPALVAGAAVVVNADGDGFDLQVLDGGEIAVPGAGRTVATASEYLANNAVHNVLDYRATGDGVTDDTAAIQAAFAAAAASGRAVFFPPGTFRCASALVPAAGVDVIGSGQQRTKLVAGGTAWLVNAVFAARTEMRCRWQGLSLLGNASSPGAVDALFAHYWSFDDVSIEDFTAVGAVGMRWRESHFALLRRMYVENVHTAGFQLARGGPDLVGPNHWTLTDSEVIGNNQAAFTGLLGDGTQSVFVERTDFEGSTNGLRGIDLSDCDGVRLIGNYIELWTSHAIRVTSSTRVAIESNVINSASNPVVQLTGCDRVRVLSNRYPDIAAGVTALDRGTSTNVVTGHNDAGNGGSYIMDTVLVDQDGPPGRLEGTGTFDPPLVAAGAIAETSVTVPGARAGMPAVAALSTMASASLSISAYVASDNTVRVVLQNLDSSSIDLGSGALRAVVFP